MIKKVGLMVPDLKNIEGFISQVSYKDGNNIWVDIYHWNTAENAHISNEKMVDKASLKNLLELIELKSVSMEILNPLQQSE